MGLGKQQTLHYSIKTNNYFMNKENKWYHFGRWVEPVLSSGIFLDFRNTDAFTITGLNFFGEIRQLEGHYFLHQKDIDRIIEFVEDKLVKKNIKWFKDFFRLCDRKIKEVLKLEEKNDLKKFFKAVVEAANCSMAIEFLDTGLEKYIEKICQRKNIELPEILNKIKPHKKTLLIKYQEELRNLKKSKTDKFLKKWEWVGTHFFMGEGLAEKKIINLLKRQQKKKKEEKFTIPVDFRIAAKIGGKMAFYRSYLIEQIDRVAYGYWPLIKKIGKENNLTWEEVISLNHYELIELKDKKILPANFKQRKAGFGTINLKGFIGVITGEKLKASLKECEQEIESGITEFKGMVACRGEKIRGIVKVIEESKNISKMKQGDILVANETTPDYIVGMKIAGAIITNQGGITSHAAITSREMKIPCIIGTKIATKVLKDGDLVEVDAERGIVKILEKR